MSRLLLCGAFGQSNPGDDALLSACATSLAGHELMATTSDPTAVYGLEPVPPTPREVTRALRAADGVVVAGGTIFKHLHPQTGRHPLGLLVRTALLEAGASFRSQPLALVGVGAGPLRGRLSRRLARGIAEHADLLVLRDEESAAVLRDASASGPFRVGADLAWSLLDHPAALTPIGASTGTRPRPEDGVLIALSHFAGSDVAELASRIVPVVDHLSALGVPVLLQPWQGGPREPDHRLAAMIHDATCATSDVCVVPPPVDLFDAVALAQSVAAVVGYRFHSLVAAAVAGRPFLAVAHEPKLAGLARRLGQLAVPPHAPIGVLPDLIDGLLASPPVSPSLIDREIDLARATLDLLRVVVGRGEEDELLDLRRTELTAGVPW